MNEKLFFTILNSLENKTMTIPDLTAACTNQILSYDQAEQFLYSSLGRGSRFLIFIALYDATLKNDTITAFRVFKEAYCATDNIFNQISTSNIPFNLKDFLKSFKSQRIDIHNLMSPDEKTYYDGLSNQFKIYRGLSKEEHDSKSYGISWSIDKEEAEKYIFFDKNNVQEGGLVEQVINKADVFSVFSVHKKMEIIYL